MECGRDVAVRYFRGDRSVAPTRQGTRTCERRIGHRPLHVSYRVASHLAPSILIPHYNRGSNPGNGATTQPPPISSPSRPSLRRSSRRLTKLVRPGNRSAWPASLICSWGLALALRDGPNSSFRSSCAPRGAVRFEALAFVFGDLLAFRGRGCCGPPPIGELEPAAPHPFGWTVVMPDVLVGDDG